MNSQRFITAVIALYVLCFLWGCGKRLPAAQATPTPNPPALVLEVVTNYSGMVEPKGDILEMRLYEDGRFEYDDFPRCLPGYRYKGEPKLVRSESRVSPDAVQQLVKIGMQPDFQSASPMYPPQIKRLPIDTASLTTIRFVHGGTEKKIQAKDFEDFRYEPEARAKYPPSLVAVYDKVQELKRDVIERSRSGCTPG